MLKAIPGKILYVFFLFITLCSGGIGKAETIDLSVGELNLTPKESRWLKGNPPVRIAGPRAFPPFHYFNEQGDLKGISADYISIIMDLLGLEVRIEANLPWPQVLDRARQGTIDLIPCIARTAEREQFLAYSQPYLSFPLVILSRKDSPFIGGVEDLYGKTLAVIEKNASYAWLREDHIEFIPFFVESPLKRMEAISLGRVDAGIENLAAASYLIEKHGLMNVKVAAPTPYGNYTLHMAVRKDLPELQGILNKALDSITPEQHMKIRNSWLSVRYEHGIRSADVLKWTLTAMAVASVILGTLLMWNRLLKREVARRKALIDRLEKALAEIKTLEGIVPICSNCKKIRDDAGYWKQIEAYIEQHSGASFSHSICPECTEKLYGNEEWYEKRKRDSV